MGNSYDRIVRGIVYWTLAKLLIIIAFFMSMRGVEMGWAESLGLVLLLGPYIPFAAIITPVLMIPDWYRRRWLYQLALANTIIALLLGVVALSFGLWGSSSYTSYSSGVLDLLSMPAALSILWIIGDIVALRYFVLLSSLFSQMDQAQLAQPIAQVQVSPQEEAAIAQKQANLAQSILERSKLNMIFYALMIFQVLVLLPALYRSVLTFSFTENSLMTVAAPLLLIILIGVLVVGRLRSAASVSDYYGRVASLQGRMLMLIFILALVHMTISVGYLDPLGMIFLVAYIVSAIFGSISLSHWNALQRESVAVSIGKVNPAR